MTANKLTLSYFGGEFRIDLEGDAEYIANERAEFNKSVLHLSNSVNKTSCENYQITHEDSSKLASETINQVNPAELKTSDIQNYESLAEFMENKGFTSVIDQTLGIAYYIDVIKGNKSFTATEIRELSASIRMSDITNMTYNINRGIKNGYIKELTDKEDGEKKFTFLKKGIQYIDEYKGGESKKPRKSTPRKKTQRSDSSLLKYSLDDLHLENYCALEDLGNASEKIHVLIYIYTKETGNEIFTHLDIEQILLEKFKIKIGSSTVRHCFGKMKPSYFNKTVNTEGQAQYRLMSDGIKEAERIILEHNPNFIPKP